MYDNIIGMLVAMTMAVTMGPVHVVRVTIMLMGLFLVSMPNVVLLHMLPGLVIAGLEAMPLFNMSLVTTMRFAAITVMTLAAVMLLIDAVFTTATIIVISHRRQRCQCQAHGQKADQR